MTEIFFYQLQRQNLEDVLPDLLERALARGWRAVVRTGGPERVAALDASLWTHGRASFLAHGTAADGRPERQPVWLTDKDENPNGAQVLFAIDGTATASPEAYARICDLFDGNDGAALAAARERWRRLAAAGHGLTYWRQKPDGGWEKKAMAEGAA